MQELFGELMAELAQKEPSRTITKIFVKLKFADFTRTTVERAGLRADARKFPHAFGRGIRSHWQKRAPDGRWRSLCGVGAAGRGAAKIDLIGSFWVEAGEGVCVRIRFFGDWLRSPRVRVTKFPVTTPP